MPHHQRPRRRRRPGVLLLGIVALIAMVWPPEDPTVWADGSVHGPWRAVYNGEGRNSASGGIVLLEPRTATSVVETHANLIVSELRYRDVDYSARVKTVRQLRVNDSPNPWEVGWAVWNYTDPQHFYYLCLKPNGWEIGKADPAYPGNQRFLMTGERVFPLGHSHDVHVVHHGASFRIWVDGSLLAGLTDDERPYTHGSVGIYAEDAIVEFEQLALHGELVTSNAD